MIAAKSNSFFGHVGESTKDPEADRNPLVKKEKSGAAEPIIVPIVLKMAEFDHKVHYLCFQH